MGLLDSDHQRTRFGALLAGSHGVFHPGLVAGVYAAAQHVGHQYVGGDVAAPPAELKHTTMQSVLTPRRRELSSSRVNTATCDGKSCFSPFTLREPPSLVPAQPYSLCMSNIRLTALLFCSMPMSRMRVRKVLPVPLLPKMPLRALHQLRQIEAELGLHIQRVADPERSLSSSPKTISMSAPRPG